MPSKRQYLRHTRIKMKTNIVDVKADSFNALGLVVGFEHDRVSGYYLPKDLIPYAVHVDRKLFEEFYKQVVKIQIESQDTMHLVDIYALPHFGFPINRGTLIPGNKIRVRFRARSYEGADIAKFLIFYDNRTTVYESTPIAFIVASTGNGGGRLYRSSRIVA